MLAKIKSLILLLALVLAVGFLKDNALAEDFWNSEWRAGYVEGNIEDDWYYDYYTPGYDSEWKGQKQEVDSGPKKEKLQGKIIAVKRVKIKDHKENALAVLLETNQGNRVVADVGLDTGVENLNISKGVHAFLEGGTQQVGDRQVFAASSIKIGERSAKIERN